MIQAVLTGFNSKIRTWPLTWAIGVVRAKGDIIIPTTYASHCYVCTTAGTSHASTEPKWNTVNATATTPAGTTTDGTAVFTTYDTKTYQNIAPQSAVFPYVTFGLETDVPIGTFASPTKIEDLNFWVNVFSNTSMNHLSIITDRILTTLDNCTLTISGYTSMKCVRTFMGSVIYDPDTLSFQQPLRYRAWITS